MPRSHRLTPVHWMDRRRKYGPESALWVEECLVSPVLQAAVTLSETNEGAVGDLTLLAEAWSEAVPVGAVKAPRIRRLLLALTFWLLQGCNAPSHSSLR